VESLRKKDFFQIREELGHSHLNVNYNPRIDRERKATERKSLIQLGNRNRTRKESMNKRSQGESLSTTGRGTDRKSTQARTRN